METNIQEVWKDIVGYNGKYKISNLGRVMSFSRMSPTGKILTQRQQYKDWYFTIGLAGGHRGTRKQYRVHRLVAIAFIPNPEKKEWINHKNGIKYDNCVENLEWSTQCENIQHAYDTGLLVRTGRKGIDSNLVKIKPEDVLEIRRIWQSDNRPSQSQIAKLFNTTQCNVSQIITRKTWAHI